MKNKIKISRDELDTLRRQQHDQSARIDELKRLASRTAFQLEDLHDRVERSKPVFERMLTKVRKRDQRYREDVKVLSSKVEKSTNIANEYRKLHEMGVAIIEKHGLLGKFTQPNTNFTDRQLPKSTMAPDVREFVTGPGRSHPKQQKNESVRREVLPQKEDEDELVPMKSPQPIKPQSLYEMLQKKLRVESRPPLPPSFKPSEPSLKQKIVQVSQQLKREASLLKQMRKSLYCGKNSTSETRLRPGKQARNIGEKPAVPLPKSASLRFIQSKQRRLESLREHEPPVYKDLRE